MKQLTGQDDAELERCTQCEIGRLHRARRPYVEMFRGYLVTLPDAIGYKCDVCHAFIFDEAVGEIVEYMISGASLPIYQEDHENSIRLGTVIKPAISVDDDPSVPPQRPKT